MKLALKTGDVAIVKKGKLAGKEGKILEIDSKNKRVKVEGLKKSKSGSKDLHGTFHINSLIKKEEPKKEAAAETTETAEA